MLSNFIRFFAVVLVCLAIVHAYPPSMSRTKWLPARVARPSGVPNERPAYGHAHVNNGNDNDSNDNNGFATWLFRSRKFCCAPPL